MSAAYSGGGLCFGRGTNLTMTRKSISRQRCLQLMAAVILLAGLGSSAVIYVSAVNSEARMMISPYESKSYRHGLELYGGKMNLLANDLMRWFEGLWEGKQRAYTVAWASILIAGVMYSVSRHMRPHDRENSAQSRQ